jgi:hypothetical protein
MPNGLNPRQQLFMLRWNEYLSSCMVTLLIKQEWSLLCAFTVNIFLFIDGFFG